MQLVRLNGRSANNRVLRKGQLWRGTYCSIRYVFGVPFNQLSDQPEGTVFLGSFASVSLHKHAVKRNRMRRRCKEALIETLKAHQKMPTVQLLLSPKFSSLESDYDLIKTDMHRFYEFITTRTI